MEVLVSHVRSARTTSPLTRWKITNPTAHEPIKLRYCMSISGPSSAGNSAGGVERGELLWDRERERIKKKEKEKEIAAKMAVSLEIS